jgi:hypothetical protein
MIFAEAANSLSPIVLPVLAFTGALLLMGAVAYVYLRPTLSAAARKATFALLLLSAAGVFLAFLYALSPDTLPLFPVVGGALFLICAITFFTSRFCPSCGRPTNRYRVVLDYTHCPYCGHPYAPAR